MVRLMEHSERVVRRLVTVREITRVLDVHADTVYRAIRTGALPAVRVGRQWRFDLDAVLALAGTHSSLTTEPGARANDAWIPPPTPDEATR